jgi:hypothetical protein
MSKFNEIYNQILFVESPQYYDAKFNEDMQNLEINAKRAQKTIEDSEKIDSFQGRDVYKRFYFGDPDRYTYVFIKNGVIDTEVEMSIKKINDFSLGVWQRNTLDNKGFARSVFLNFLPKYHNAVVSDTVANKLGREFWKKLLDDAVSRGYKVTVIEKQKEKNYYPKDFDSFWRGSIVDDSSVMPGEKLFKITY